MIEQLHKLLLNNYENPLVILQKNFQYQQFSVRFHCSCCFLEVFTLISLHDYYYYLNFIVFLLFQFLDSSSPPAYLVFAAKQRVLKQGLRILDVPYVLYETVNKSIVITGKIMYIFTFY